MNTITFNNRLQTCLLWVALVLLNACNKKSEEIAPQYLIESTTVAEVNRSEINQRIPGIPLIATLTNFDVRAVRIVYRTKDPDGQEVRASGILIFPTNPNRPLALLSHQHGTITNDNQAPSNYTNQSEAWSIGTVLASAGYVVAAPDYLGYGVSRNIPHPYEHAKNTAQVCLDMLRAAKEYCRINRIQLNDKLFLTGYSQGGNATMALHKKIEEEASNEFRVTASAPGAGAYHKTGFADFLVNTNQPQPSINLYLWVLDTYNRIYKINRPWTAMLTQPSAAAVQANGVFTLVNPNPQQLFTAEFAAGIRNRTDAAFINAFRDNDVHDWRPQAPVRLYHGTADTTVPIFHSRNALDAMRRRGAADVQLVEIPGGDHISAIQQYIFGMFFFFAGLQ
ncbi:MAG: alpha/beta fold hydrolase [Cytophagales bacterium]|nr:alpha/beta fold hydrolase [Bernardetiaceae bacterium]MDW8204629.1 alpha/beta fold hydrolase [Cytophagales bacterium]